ncbi:MAG: type II secretion system GspH family protein [Saccharofermentans sp.]|nr:type II secretion system GspH family protein [Saccharofermentans sp.]
MKKIGKNSKKGFTLVELIVVLVILAVMAAMLVPALTGYIKKARTEKDYQAASEALVAAQALVTEYYAKTPEPSTDGAVAYVTGTNISKINDLLGSNIVTASTVTVDANYSITSASFTIGQNVYTYTASTNTWAAAATT